MTLKEAELLLNEDNTYWTFDDDCCHAYYFSWVPDEEGRIGYISTHKFRYRYLKSLDPKDWEDEDRWTSLTFGDAYNCPTYLEDFYDEAKLISYAENNLRAEDCYSIPTAMRILQEEIENA